MAGRGPAADPNSRRQQRTVMANGWVDLPPDGCSREVPGWPWGAATPAEEALWGTLWRTPQAEAWHITCTSPLVVASYVQVSCAARETGEAKYISEARHLADKLGLEPVSMARNRWRVKASEDEDKGKGEAVSKPSRRMLRAVKTDAVEAAGA